ncbi:hypothetical protein QL285_037051 [Trifolium repens]|nr:hypothetical protein QL285_037051 [Trifolium repens]
MRVSVPCTNGGLVWFWCCDGGVGGYCFRCWWWLWSWVIGVCCSGDGLGGGLFAPATTDEVLGGLLLSLWVSKSLRFAGFFGIFKSGSLYLVGIYRIEDALYLDNLVHVDVDCPRVCCYLCA